MTDTPDRGPFGAAVMDRPATFKRSRRARHLRIRVSLQHGVVVTVPVGVSDASAQSFLRQHQQWVQRALAELSAGIATHGDANPSALPGEIELPAIGLRYEVRYREAAMRTRVRRGRGELVVQGRLADPAASRAALKRWLLREGRDHLPDWLSQLSREVGLGYRRVSVRAQRGRWGSCTSAKTISLNCKLLFLPPPLVRYVLLHELAHTVHLNHSSRFWNLVARLEPDYRLHERNLRLAGGRVPAWIEWAA